MNCYFRGLPDIENDKWVKGKLGNLDGEITVSFSLENRDIFLRMARQSEIVFYSNGFTITGLRYHQIENVYRMYSIDVRIRKPKEL